MKWKTLASILIFIVCMMTCSKKIFAATPNINNVNGTIYHDNNIKIYGESFGTKTRANPEIWDTVDNISAWDNLSDGDEIPYSGGGPWHKSSLGLKYRTSRPQRHQFSSAQYFGKNEGVIRDHDCESKNLLIIWWWKPSGDFQPVGASNKLFRLGNNYSGPEIRVSWRENQSKVSNYIDDNMYAMSNLWADWGGKVDEWNRHRAYFDNENRKAYLYTNNKLIHKHDYSDPKNTLNVDTINMLGLDANQNPGIVFDMTDIYVDTTQSRVEIGNKPTYSKCTHLEVQIPTLWNRSEINVNINQGSFPNGEQAYLFVINEDGTKSSGYPITFGEQKESTSLSQVTGFRVKY